ncbi:MAG: pyrroline-5-carboxylate reductase [Deltaproteobacteria bacterium]|nr:pyrroline-5-carboxylate reductase [Deltaproteobacteria bacterium]
MKENRTLGFVGAGNMATALIKGLLESGLYTPEQLWASDRDTEARDRMSDQFGIRITESNSEVLRRNATVLFAVKPQIMMEVLAEVKADVRADHLFISIAAGTPLEKIRAAIDRDIPMIRVMPNTPALIQKGISALARGPLATSAHFETARSILNAVGDTVEVDEALMDAVTALSGSGPGYVFRFMECMAEAGAAVGLERETALGLVIQTFVGAAHLAKESDRSLAELREMVTSPGGTTAAGLTVFNNMGLEKMVTKAIKAACDRAVELGKTG